ncbi:hypothetical protein KR018_003704 [Drosophila ironensis]|nr:hypothetical protein KR018_003704 [Drosophila ironensis]
MESLQIYRHKKFDMGRNVERAQLLLKEELLSRSSTPISCCNVVKVESEEDISISLCSSDQDSEFMPLPKRRRLMSASESSSISSTSFQAVGQVNADAIHDILKYHVNMVRTFPKKERSPKEQDRRNKNTIACRMSRRKKKFDDLQIEQQYKEFTSEHLKIAEQSVRAKVYLNYLNQLVKQEEGPASSPLPKATPRIPNDEHAKRNFSIDYLIGGVKREKA